MKMTRMRRIALVVAGAAAFAAGAARAGQDPEFYVNTYRSIGTLSGTGARGTAMGGTGAGLADGVNALAGNPAGLGAFTGYGVDMSLGYGLLDDGRDNVSDAAFKLGGAMSIERYRPTGGGNQALGALVQTRSYSGAYDAKMKREQTGLTLGYGLHVLPDLVAGVSSGVYDGDWTAHELDAAGVKTDLIKRSFTGGEFKVGGIMRVDDGLTVGAVFGYSTGSYREKADYATLGDKGSLRRWNVRAGAAYRMCDETLLTADVWYDRMKTRVKGVFDEGNVAWGAGAGVEQRLLDDALALRGGVYYDRTSYRASGTRPFDFGSFGKGRFGFTAGAAVRIYSFDLGYSLDVDTGGNVENHFDISAEW
ncbi:MAG: hypothetical protein LBJ46_06075 [Planctomycetota bacterium]|jgi:hypothetical protein|nr:hypothetical protein [Planctomycetota bacterium]